LACLLRLTSLLSSRFWQTAGHCSL
jgi:hypothetical protein